MVDRLPPIAVSASHSQPRQAGLSQKSRLERSKPEAGGGTPVDRGGERRGEGRREVEKHTRRYTIFSLQISSVGLGLGSQSRKLRATFAADRLRTDDNRSIHITEGRRAHGAVPGAPRVLGRLDHVALSHVKGGHPQSRQLCSRKTVAVGPREPRRWRGNGSSGSSGSSSIRPPSPPSLPSTRTSIVCSRRSRCCFVPPRRCARAIRPQAVQSPCPAPARARMRRISVSPLVHGNSTETS